MLTLRDCQQRDAADTLRPLRELFSIPAGLIYLDGNSLGAMPKAVVARVNHVVAQEWGHGLISSWNAAGWFTLPQRVGNLIAPLIGAGRDEVVATDGTSTNLYKVLCTALSMAASQSTTRRVVLSERDNFPTDLYIAQSICSERGFTLQLVDSPAEIAPALTNDVAVLMLSHVNYRSGAMHDMASCTQAAHAVGAWVVWDLAHSTGAVPVDLTGTDADFAVGCGYKYLNGGPGAPAFVWVNPKHSNRLAQPLSGWWGHHKPFAFSPDYAPASGITRYLTGSQPIVNMALLETALDCFAQAQAISGTLAGMAALRAKSLALTDLFIELVEQRCSGMGLAVVTPRAHAQRGSQVSLTHHDHAASSSNTDAVPSGFAIVQALIARGVVGDFRAGDGGTMQDLLRFGFTPLYLGFEEVWHAVEHLREVLVHQEWRQAAFQQRPTVT